MCGDQPASPSRISAGWFTTLHARGLLRTPDSMLAAQHFNWLVLSIPLNAAMSAPILDTPPDPGVLHRYADEGVRVFLAAYGAGLAEES